MLLEQIAEIGPAEMEFLCHPPGRDAFGSVLRDKILRSDDDRRLTILLLHEHLVAQARQLLGENSREPDCRAILSFLWVRGRAERTLCAIR